MNYKKLAICLGLPQLAGILGSFFTMSSVKDWYPTLVKPFFTPPNWLFGPMWITLYLLMGISAYLIWSSYSSSKKVMNLFWFHLFLNAIWTPVFFGLKNPLAGLVIIVILWLMILILIIKFWRIKRTAAILLIPYLLWVSLATALNYFIWYLN